MTVSLAAVVKKAAVYVATNKKALKTVVGIVLGAFVFLVTPIVAVLGIFTGDVNIDTDRLKEMIAEQQIVAEETMTGIEEKMAENGYTAEQTEKAKTLYLFALYPYGNTENFADKLVGCFKSEQTDEELLASVNATFGTKITEEEWESILQSMKDQKGEDDG